MEGYCLKDKKKVKIKDPMAMQMKNGRPAISGDCPDCGTKIYKIGDPGEEYYREEYAQAIKILGEEYFY